MATIPYREWTAFDIITLEGHETGGFNGWIAPGDWTNVYRAYGIIGQHRVTLTDRWIWYSVMKPSANSFELIAGADMPANYRLDFRVTKESWEAQPCTIANVEMMTMWNAGNAWLPGTATGRYIDGLAIDWDNYPINEGYGFANLEECRPTNDPPLNRPYCDVLRTDVVGDPTPAPFLIECEVPSNFAALEACTAAAIAELFQNGIQVKIDAFKNGGWCNLSNGEKITLNVFPERLKVKYFNPVVNSFSRYRIPTAGGVDLVINGMGFANDFDEINDLCGINADAQWGAQLTVSTIKFYTTDGVLAGTITTPLNEFTVNSDTQITIPAITLTALALVEGTYYILLSKGALTNCGATEGYAGDWRSGSNGRMYEGERLLLLVADEEPDEDPPEVRTKWKWKKGDTTIDKYYSPLDTRGDNFYDGRIKSVSPFTRSIDDKTGLFSVSDTNVTLANQDKEFSKLLAEYFLKNQIVEFYHGWGRQPEAWQTHVFQGVVDDYSLEGVHFDVAIKDITRKYFKIKVPQYICTEEATDYPNVHESGIGKVRPEVLGIASLIPAVASEDSGAVEAVYVDTTTFSYLAANFSLNSITQVYSNNVLQNTPADYVVAYRDGGRTYIDFTGAGDQGDNKITFNATGYSVGMWDSANGYIQNPAYIISFYLTQILGMPIAYLDMDSFDILAALYVTAGWHQAGFLVIQTERDSMAVLQELLFTYGAKLWPAKDGCLTIGRKDITNFATDLFIFDQIDLYAPANRKYNLNEAVNFVNAKWNYAPAHSIYQDAIEDRRQASIDDYEKEMSPSSDWLFPWTTSQTLVEKRLTEELLKRSYGDKKIEFSVNIKFIDDLDIFTNFRFQDPFGLSSTGAGEYGHYYYVESLSYDFQSQKIDVVGIDMQWLIRQYLIIGDCSVISDDYLTATEHDRMYAYISDCATNQFSNGDPGKKVADCDVF